MLELLTNANLCEIISLSFTNTISFIWQIVFVITSKLISLDFHIETKMAILSNLHNVDQKPYKMCSCLTSVILVVKVRMWGQMLLIGNRGVIKMKQYW